MQPYQHLSKKQGGAFWTLPKFHNQVSVICNLTLLLLLQAPQLGAGAVWGKPSQARRGAAIKGEGQARHVDCPEGSQHQNLAQPGSADIQEPFTQVCCCLPSFTV